MAKKSSSDGYGFSLESIIRLGAIALVVYLVINYLLVDGSLSTPDPTVSQQETPHLALPDLNQYLPDPMASISGQVSGLVTTKVEEAKKNFLNYLYQELIKRLSPQ